MAGLSYCLATAVSANREPRNNLSVVILNHDGADTTIKALNCVRDSTGDHILELLVVDAGSPQGILTDLKASAPKEMRLIDIGTSRSFGEACNIGADSAEGDYLLFLDNKVRVERSCVDRMLSTLQDDPSTAAVGPLFLDPDRSVQDGGGLIDENCELVPITKSGTWPPGHYEEQYRVDYCSATCLLVRRTDFLEINGFSHQWESPRYGDADLCLTLWRTFGPVVINPQARAVRLEMPTPSSRPQRSYDQSEIDRITFNEKWGDWLNETRTHATSPPTKRQGTLSNVERRRDRAGAVNETTVALFSPYELIPGGGERVLFELALVLTETTGAGHAALVTPHAYSSSRIRQLSEIFGISDAPVPVTLERLRTMAPDIMVVLGNQAVPPTRAFGKRLNIYVCQFPFTAPDHYLRSHAPFLESFDEIWVYSDFVRQYVNGHIRLLGLQPPTIRVMYPPATIPPPAELPDWSKRKTILAVGRFFRGGHDKRQDIVIEIARELSQRLGRSVPLAIAGSVHATPESRDRFLEISSMRNGIDCRLYPNISRAHLIDLYTNAAVLVHSTGFGVDALAFPERLEHFGITPIEAASLGCIPVVYGEGGPAEVMRLLECPTIYHSLPEAVDLIERLFEDIEASSALSNELRNRTAIFSSYAFRRHATEVISERLAQAS